MCGIAGIVGPQADLDGIQCMLSVQAHRGPDHTGIFLIEGEVALGHNRLSILDLSDAAHQPFKSPAGELVLIFNGEIYNYLELKVQLGSKYTFRSSSDTEVLLYAYMEWGRACLQRLNGMFSFAIWDGKSKKLFAARDRFGVKPFFYARHQGSMVFSSEISPIWSAGFPKNPNQKVWANYFSFGDYGKPEESFWQGIDQLPPGHWLVWENGQLTIERWYDFIGQLAMQPEIPEQDQEAYIFGLMLDSVRLRFRADVPVGFNLSGGLDSSTLLALVSQIRAEDSRVQAFTFITGDQNYDELPWVKVLLSGKPYPLSTCLLKPEEVPQLTQWISNIQSEPFGGIPTLAYSKIFEQARAQNVLVLLDGQGADEAWAGYDYYVKNNGGIVQGVSGSPVRPGVLNREFAKMAESPNYPKPFSSELLNLQYRDLFHTKIPRALRFNDRISMAHGTELREPFLDYRLVEYVFSRPESFKIQNGQQKWLLRKLAHTYLGENIALAPKRPVQTPQREWLGGKLSEWVFDRLDVLCSQTRWFDREIVMEVWNDYLQGKQENSFFIWQWINASYLISIANDKL
jgi:asparagine synthase (glutamine-hydrolysing)